MTDEAAANAWWDELPARRRIQIHRWIVAPGETHEETPEQLPLLDTERNTDEHRHTV